MRLLDLFCGAGGAAMGYHQAGFTEIVGVDNRPMKRYPFEFVLGDALEYVREHGHEFDMIHASPPCQAYSSLRHLTTKQHPELVEPTRELLQETGRPYVIENVVGAPLINPLMLCGTMFAGLKVRRHRLFECWPVVWFPPRVCNHDYGRIPSAGRGASSKGFVSVTGKGGRGITAGLAYCTDAMGMHHKVTQAELSQAIPPAYTEWLGGQMMNQGALL